MCDEKQLVGAFVAKRLRVNTRYQGCAISVAFPRKWQEFVRVRIVSNGYSTEGWGEG
jgi:hypothetical protein